MSIFTEIDQAAVRLVRRGVEPKFAILTPRQIDTAMSHPDAPRHITHGPGWLVKIVGLPYCVLQDYDGPLVLGEPYPALPKSICFDADYPITHSTLGGKIERLADAVEGWDHGSGHRVMATLVKSLRALAKEAHQ